jgi:hypothetical protein
MTWPSALPKLKIKDIIEVGDKIYWQLGKNLYPGLSRSGVFKESINAIADRDPRMKEQWFLDHHDFRIKKNKLN